MTTTAEWGSDVAKHVKCLWHVATKRWTVIVDLYDGTQREVPCPTRARSRKTSIRKIVDGVLAAEGLKPSWDMHYGWEEVA